MLDKLIEIAKSATYVALLTTSVFFTCIGEYPHAIYNMLFCILITLSDIKPIPENKRGV